MIIKPLDRHKVSIITENESEPVVIRIILASGRTVMVTDYSGYRATINIFDAKSKITDSISVNREDAAYENWRDKQMEND